MGRPVRRPAAFCGPRSTQALPNRRSAEAEPDEIDHLFPWRHVSLEGGAAGRCRSRELRRQFETCPVPSQSCGQGLAGGGTRQQFGGAELPVLRRSHRRGPLRPCSRRNRGRRRLRHARAGRATDLHERSRASRADAASLSRTSSAIGSASASRAELLRFIAAPRSSASIPRQGRSSEKRTSSLPSC
jgi:hypothetical protein